MFYQSTKKVTNGKLVSVKIDADEIMNAVHIYGDFFLHPEEALTAVEESIEGLSVNTAVDEISQKIEETLTAQKAAFVGVSPDDIAWTIWRALHEENAL